MYQLDYSAEEIQESYSKNNHFNHYLINFYKKFQSSSCFPPGHYYSPLMDAVEIKEMEKSISAFSEESIAGIDLSEQEQIGLLEHFVQYYDKIPFPRQKNLKFRYYFENDVFGYTDAIMLYSFMQHKKPRRIIEVGSGFSSALMLDANSVMANNQIQLTFIEPYPERLYSLINESDRSSCTILEDKVQNVQPGIFKALNANDILFIDGSHVSKTGSDLNHLMFNILPYLNQGVIVHFHDIFYPFEYPLSWIYEGRNWNENYLLRAFLTYNEKFKILMFNDFMHKFHAEKFENLSDCYKNFGGSIWLEKVG